MTHPALRLLATATRALRLPDDTLSDIAVTGEGALPSAFAVTDFAAATVAAAAVSLRALRGTTGADAPALALDRRLAALWFMQAIRPIGWELPAAWDAIAGDYPTRDGWIRLHTNAPHHRAAALRVLGCAGERAAVTAAVSGWNAEALETAVVAQGGVAAQMRGASDWRRHPQGAAVAAEPLVAWALRPASSAWRPAPARPLAGVKVLDLTRILAGPVATRFLAGHGADVLRIDPPGWDEPSLAPEVTLGKRCARLDLEDAPDRATFERLLAQADVLVHGYRPGALDALGYAQAWRERLNPGLVDVSLDAYGWSGPWATRRGYDSLVQMSCGIAARGQAWRGAAKPVPLPMQALDHATGYLVAASVIRGLLFRLVDGQAATARLSLARTAQFLMDEATGESGDVPAITPGAEDESPEIEATPWGDARRLKNAAALTGVPQAWPRPAGRLGGDEPRWAAG